MEKEVRSTRPDCIFRDRLKNVKASLRSWSKERFGDHKTKIELYKNEAMRLELEAERRTLDDGERANWMEARKRWEEKENEYRICLGKKLELGGMWKETKIQSSFIRMLRGGIIRVV